MLLTAGVALLPHTKRARESWREKKNEVARIPHFPQCSGPGFYTPAPWCQRENPQESPVSATQQLWAHRSACCFRIEPVKETRPGRKNDNLIRFRRGGLWIAHVLSVKRGGRSGMPGRSPSFLLSSGTPRNQFFPCVLLLPRRHFPLADSLPDPTGVLQQ